MKIIHITAECYPIAKVGGLADVAGSLPIYQNKLGENSCVVMPFYDTSFTQDHFFTEIFAATLSLDKDYTFRLLTLDNNTLGFELYFVDIPELLFTKYVYSADDTKRFLAFQVAALTWISGLKKVPDVVHCHDHHTGLVPYMMSHCENYTSLKTIPSIFTIHNAQYQGWFSHDQLYLFPKFDLTHLGLLDWDHVINPLAAAIKCAWRVTTVSPSYMKELKEKANGLEDLLAHESDKCVGILNGIDSEVWNPETDSFIVKNYTIRSISEGKKNNKKWLCKEFNLDPKNPLFVFIGRLVGEKGADLFSEIFDNALAHHKISVLLLGSGNEAIENSLYRLKVEHPHTYNSYIGYDEKLSHRMYAGADFLLMPSRVEPCGLNQMYALRYGTVPIVNSVGGLIDTVIDIDQGGFGIRHDALSVDQVVHAIARGVALFLDSRAFNKTREKMMTLDNSWDASAKKYITLYKSIK